MEWVSLVWNYSHMSLWDLFVLCVFFYYYSFRGVWMQMGFAHSVATHLCACVLFFFIVFFSQIEWTKWRLARPKVFSDQFPENALIICFLSLSFH